MSTDFLDPPRWDFAETMHKSCLAVVFVALLSGGSVLGQTSITPTSHEVGAGEVSYQILVNSAVDWMTTKGVDWVTLSRTSGSGDMNILVTAAANATGADRCTTIRVDGAAHTLTQRTETAALEELWAFGSDNRGQLGDNVWIQPPLPSEVAVDVQAVAAGAGHSLIVRTDGSLWATGSNVRGQIGDGTTTDRPSPVRIISAGVQAVAAGGNHSLMLKTDGSLWGMGANGYGQLGDGTTIDRLNPVPVLSGGVQAVAAGDGHTLIVKTDGSLWGMGRNDHGQLGDGSTTNRTSPVLILSGGVQTVAAGLVHSLIVKTDGSLWTMGYNAYCQLGDGTATQRNFPVQILSAGVQTAAAGDAHSLVVKTDGSLWAMGDDYFGMLSDGTTPIHSRPVQIMPSGVATVAAGEGDSLIVKTDGSLWTMGNANGGQLGDGTWTRRTSPVQVASSGVQAVAAGFGFSLFVKTDGSLWGMGSNSAGQLGDGMKTKRTKPIQVLAGGIQALATGWSHSLLVKTDGSLWGMGYNYHGELGDGTGTQRNAPVQILSSGVRAVAAGYGFSLLVKTDGSLWSMGANGSGQLGDGTTTQRNAPVQILSSGVRAAEAGSSFSLFVKTDGSLWGMGANYYGQLGDGTTTRRTSPVQILADGIRTVEAGDAHSLIVKTDGSLWAMGANLRGELGDGTTIQRNFPVQIFPTGVQAVAAGDRFSLVVKTNGSLWAMGDNEYGQLGDGTTTDRPSPVQVLPSGVQAVAVGFGHSLILMTDGSLWATGDNEYGQLGDGTTAQRVGPELIAANAQKISAGAFHSLVVARGDIQESIPRVTDQPANRTVSTGAIASFTVGVSGSPVLLYYWQVSVPGSTSWTDLTDGGVYSGVNTATLAITGATAGLNGNVYRCVIFNPAGHAVSDWARLTVTAPVVAPAVSTSPAHRTVVAGGSTDFTVEVNGTAPFSYYWQVSAPGSTSWTDLANGGVYSGVNTTTLAIMSATAGLNGNVYRCVIFNPAGHAVSEWARLTVNSLVVAPAVTGQPGTDTVIVGAMASFTVEASGSPTLLYYWQVSAPGSTSWTDLTDGGVYSGVNAATLTITGATAGLNGNVYRCVIFNPVGHAVSDWARLTVGGALTAPAVTDQPSTTTVAASANASFTVGVTGSPTLLYFWQVSAPGSTSWTDLTNGGVYSGVNAATLTITGATAGLNGNVYRCVIFNPVGHAVSDWARLTVTTLVVAPVVTTQPTNKTVASSGNASYTVTVNGTPALLYYWQVSAPGSTSWTDLANSGVYSGVNTATLTIAGATIGLSGNVYRCVIFNPAGHTVSEWARLTVASSQSSSMHAVQDAATVQPAILWSRPGVPVSRLLERMVAAEVIFISLPGDTPLVAVNARWQQLIPEGYDARAPRVSLYEQGQTGEVALRAAPTEEGMLEITASGYPWRLALVLDADKDDVPDLLFEDPVTQRCRLVILRVDPS